MAFRDYWEELKGTIPRLPPNLAQTYINRAWTDIRDYRLWSWLVGVGFISTPTAITTGLVDATLGSTDVLFTVAAAAALNAVALANPPLANAQIGLGRQFRLSSQTSGTPGPLYNIVAWDNSTRTATLDRVYAEETITASPYTVYKAYYQPPPSNGTATPDFLRYLSVTNTPVGYTIRGQKLYYTQPQLDGIDPQRGATGDAYILAAYEDNPGSDVSPLGPQMFPIHEWYPHPVYARVYKCIFQKRMLALSDTQSLPVTIPETVLMARAFVHGAQWALGQVAVFPELAQTNWVNFITIKQQEYKETLLQCIKQDDEIFPQKAFTQGWQFDFPLGGQFLQGHDVSSLVGGLG